VEADTASELDVRDVPHPIRRLIPSGLELDTLDGAAWVGLVPFEIYGTPGIPHFPETNLRTYVVGPDGCRAVWFFSLEAARLAAVVGARIGYRLPYFWARMQIASRDAPFTIKAVVTGRTIRTL
jgi:uncharacterized protein